MKPRTIIQGVGIIEGASSIRQERVERQSGRVQADKHIRSARLAAGKSSDAHRGLFQNLAHRLEYLKPATAQQCRQLRGH